MIDWVKGIPYTVFKLPLNCGYVIELDVSQHQSGKVTINQSVSLTIGFFSLKPTELKLGHLGNLRFMDKLNKVLRKEIEA